MKEEQLAVRVRDSALQVGVEQHMWLIGLPKRCVVGGLGVVGSSVLEGLASLTCCLQVARAGVCLWPETESKGILL